MLHPPPGKREGWQVSETQKALSRPRTAAEYRETVIGCLHTANMTRKPAVAPACFRHERTGSSGCAEPRYAAKDERMATTKMTVTFTPNDRVTPQEARRRGVALPPH